MLSNPLIHFSSKKPSLKVWVSKGLKEIPTGVFLGTNAVIVNLKKSKANYSLLLIKAFVPLVFYFLFFNYAFNVDTGETPFFLFVFSGMLIWYFFIESFSAVVSQFEFPPPTIKNSTLHISVIPVSAFIQVAIEFLPYLIIFIVALLFYNINFTGGWLLIPFFALLSGVIGVASGIIASQMGYWIKQLYSTLKQIISFFIWFTPVFYPLSILPKELSNLAFLNPLTGIISVMRSFLFEDFYNSSQIIISIAVTLTIFILGFVCLYLFDRKIVEP